MPAARRLTVALCLAVGLMGPGLAVPTSPLAEQLLAAETLPVTQQARRVALLQAVQPPAGSNEALEKLYLLATTRGQPEPPEADWLAWQRAAGAARAPFADWVRRLAELHRQLDLDQFRQARQSADALPALPTLAAGAAPHWSIRSLLLRARAIEETGEPQAALLLRLEAAPLLDAEAQPWRQAQGLSALANTYSRLGQHERALTSALEGLRSAEQSPQPDVLARQHSVLSAVHSRAGRDEESRIEGERALAQARLTGDKNLLALLLSNQADAYLKLGDPARALALTNEAYPLALDQSASGSLIITLLNRGLAQIQLGRLAAGKDDVKRAVTLELQGGGIAYAAEGLTELGAALARAGDLPGAYAAYGEARELQERAFQASRGEALAAAQQAFDAAQRTREAERLRQQTELQAEALRAQRLRAGLAALALACGAGVLALSVLLVRRMRRANQALQAVNRELSDASERDALTGLGNRRRLQRLRRGRRDDASDGPLGLLIIDIDHFKSINDRHGHAAGDRVLSAVAGRLRSAVREPEAVLRWGGEEFLVLLNGADAPTTAALAQRLMQALGDEPVSLRDGQSLPVRVCIGALTLPLAGVQPPLSLTAAIDIADALLYRAKAQGRNQALVLMRANVDSPAALQAALAEPGMPSLDVQRLRGPELAP